MFGSGAKKSDGNGVGGVIRLGNDDDQYGEIVCVVKGSLPMTKSVVTRGEECD